MKIELFGCERYNYRGTLFEKGKTYILPRAKANVLLAAKEDRHQTPYFRIAMDRPAKAVDPDMTPDLETDQQWGKDVEEVTDPGPIEDDEDDGVGIDEEDEEPDFDGYEDAPEDDEDDPEAVIDPPEDEVPVPAPKPKRKSRAKKKK